MQILLVKFISTNSHKQQEICSATIPRVYCNYSLDKVNKLNINIYMYFEQWILLLKNMFSEMLFNNAKLSVQYTTLQSISSIK